MPPTSIPTIPALAVSDVPGGDVVEVLRATSVSSLGQAATIAGAVAGVAVLAVVVARLGAVRTTGPRTTSALLGATAVASIVEAALLLLDGVPPTERRVLVVALRLVLLAGLELARRASVAPDPETSRGPGPLTGLVLLLLVLTVPLAAPGAGTGFGLAAALRGWGAATAVVALLLWATSRWRALAPVPALAGVLVVGAVAGIVVAPERLPPYVEQRVVVDGVALDLTVAPATVGRNEFHLYAWDTGGEQVPVDAVWIAVAGAPETAHQLLRVSANHHLSYVLDLPTSDSGWVVEVAATTASGEELEARLSLEAP